MNHNSIGQRSTSNRLRAELLGRLISRHSEIEQTVLARVRAVSLPDATADPAYVEGLRGAVSAALAFGLAGVDDSGAHSVPIPPELYTQARQAARNGVSLDTVLRRYFAGYTLLGDFILQEAGQDRLLGDAALRGVLRTLALRFDHLIAAIADEYESEARSRPGSPQQRRAECVERLLSGELTDPAELAYDIDGWHLGVVAGGPGAEQTIRGLANSLDRRLLLLPRGDGMVWAWLGGRQKVAAEATARLVTDDRPGRGSLAIGEPGRGLAGWRLSHRQAAAAWPIALHRSKGLVVYSDVILLASMMSDDLLVSSLGAYLAPLAKARDGGTTLLKTLRAYFAADRNVSSAAAALNVSRSTVTNHLSTVEELLERSLNSCATEVEAALRLEEVNHIAPPASLLLDKLSQVQRTSTAH